MKKNLLITLSLTLSLYSQAQIALTNSDMPTAGWTQRIGRDTIISGINWGNPGANQTYTFTNFQQMEVDTTMYKAMTSTQQSKVPGADLAVTNDDINFLYSKSTANELSFYGLEGVLLGSNDYIVLNPVSKFYQFPTQYQGSFSGSSGFVKEKLGADFNPPLEFNGVAIYQVKVTNTTTYKDTIDGWGKVTTPVGSYKCLRQKRVEASTTKVEVKLTSFSPYTQVSNTTTTNTRYYYLTKEAKGSVVNFTYDTLNNPTAATWSLIPPAAPDADFTFANGANGQVSFTDATDGYPDTYSWNFGDNSPTSNAVNPNHTYAANGKYVVCLTVTNAGGSTTHCDTVTISNLTTGIKEAEVALLKVYPNPVKDALQVDLSQFAEYRNTELVITDFSGRIVSKIPMKGNNQDTYTINVSNLQSGMYSLAIINGKERLALTTFVKD
jgi:PKD repeat protein